MSEVEEVKKKKKKKKSVTSNTLEVVGEEDSVSIRVWGKEWKVVQTPPQIDLKSHAGLPVKKTTDDAIGEIEVRVPLFEAGDEYEPVECSGLIFYDVSDEERSLCVVACRVPDDDPEYSALPDIATLDPMKPVPIEYFPRGSELPVSKQLFSIPFYRGPLPDPSVRIRTRPNGASDPPPYDPPKQVRVYPKYDPMDDFVPIPAPDAWGLPPDTFVMPWDVQRSDIARRHPPRAPIGLVPESTAERKKIKKKKKSKQDESPPPPEEESNLTSAPDGDGSNKTQKKRKKKKTKKDSTMSSSSP